MSPAKAVLSPPVGFFHYFSCLQAVTRITERDGVSPEDALRRLQSQWPSSRQLEHANVVLSTLWEPKVTRKQVGSLTMSPSQTSRDVHQLKKNVLSLKGPESLEPSPE